MNSGRGAWIGAAITLAAAGCARPTLDDSPSLFSDESDQVERLVPVSVDEAWTAVEEVLREQASSPPATDRDGLGGDLVARRAGGRIFVRIRTVDEDRTRILVRREPADRAEAGRFHDAIARRLGLGEAKGGLFGGCSERIRVDRPLDASVQAVREAFRALRIEETGAATDGRTADLRGRGVDSTPVRVRLEPDGPGATEATFIAGARKSAAHRELARRLRREFERRSN